MTESTVPEQANTDTEADDQETAKTPTMDTSVDGPILSDDAKDDEPQPAG